MLGWADPPDPHGGNRTWTAKIKRGGAPWAFWQDIVLRALATVLRGVAVAWGRAVAFDPGTSRGRSRLRSDWRRGIRPPAERHCEKFELSNMALSSRFTEGVVSPDPSNKQ